MKLTVVLLEFASPFLTLLLTIITICKARQVNKMKNQTAEAQENVKIIEASILKVKEQIANNNQISQITEMKEKTANFQKTVFKYLKDPKSFKSLGYSITSDHEEINYYITYIKENNWIFDEAHENYADNLYNELMPLSNAFTRGASWQEIHLLVLSIKPRFESFKSKISKMHYESMHP